MAEERATPSFLAGRTAGRDREAVVSQKNPDDNHNQKQNQKMNPTDRHQQIDLSRTGSCHQPDKNRKQNSRRKILKSGGATDHMEAVSFLRIGHLQYGVAE